jgi:glycosyltransferase involved in cell wall biosynthesis
LSIALDATYSLDRHLTGVGVYSRQLLFGLARAHPDSQFTFLYRPHRFLRSFQDSLPKNVRRGTGFSLWRSCELFHGLNQRVDSARYRRTISTFHDLFVLTGDYSTSEFRQRFAAQARLAAQRSDLIIAVSAFTAGQVRDLLNVEASRIRVIHHGVSPPPAAGGATIAREPMVLFTGSLQHRKNVLRLIEAFERAAPSDWTLVLAGSTGFGAEEILRRAGQNQRIVVTGYVSNDELNRLYSRAAVFAFPSLDEGFGMPVLDAMARGVPVLTSNKSALPEVAGDAALLVEPASVDSIETGLKKLIEDEALRTELSNRGIERARQFSWGKAVEETWQVYGELLAG